MRSRPRDAIGLVELLITIGVIGVLIGILLPAVQGARESAGRLGCQNNLKHIGLAVHHFHDAHGALPPGPGAYTSRDSLGQILGWMVFVLPELEHQAVYEAALVASRIDADPLHSPPHSGMEAIIRTLACPSDGRLRNPMTDAQGVRSSFTSYIGIGGSVVPGARGKAGVLGMGRDVTLSMITDGLSSTLLVGERPPPGSLQAGWWYPAFRGSGDGRRGPNNALVLGQGLDFAGDPCAISQRAIGPGSIQNPCDRFHLWSLHGGGANGLLCDGSVRFFAYSGNEMLFGLGSRDGGEVVDLP